MLLLQGSSKSNRKKSQLPVQLDLGGMLAALEQKQQAEKSKQSPKPVVLSGKSFKSVFIFDGFRTRIF